MTLIVQCKKHDNLKKKLLNMTKTKQILQRLII